MVVDDVLDDVVVACCNCVIFCLEEFCPIMLVCTLGDKTSPLIKDDKVPPLLTVELLLLIANVDKECGLVDVADLICLLFCCDSGVSQDELEGTVLFWNMVDLKGDAFGNVNMEVDDWIVVVWRLVEAPIKK